ncbi:MAG: PorT family protein [Acidobacteriota bacterium]|nr:PorT family protein [Acidobacteriota bacterium]
MMKKVALAVLLLSSALPAAAQNWSFGASTGPFVFGDFLHRKLRPTTGNGSSGTQTLTLSAATRAGLAVDLERSFGERWAVRAEAAFTRSPLTVRQSGSGGVELDAGEMDVTTVIVPIIFRINPHGTFRFHVMGGPAAAAYHLDAPRNVTGVRPAFEGTEYKYGVAFGGGAAWWLRERFAIEGAITDTITGSPVEEEQFADRTGIEIPKPHNVHTTIGLRWRF